MRALVVMTLWSILLGGAGLWPHAVRAQDGIKVQVTEISCRDMLKMESEEQELTLVFLHGFMSGKAGATEVDGPALRAATETIKDACIDAPDASLFSVFETVRGG